MIGLLSFVTLDLPLGLFGGGLAIGLLTFFVVQALLRVNAGLVAERNTRSPLNQLLAFVADFVARRRGLDVRLDRRLTELEALVRQSGGAFLNGASGAEVFVARWVLPVLVVLFLGILLPLLRLPSGMIFLMLALFGVMSFAWPESALRAAAQARTRLFARQLPGALDILRLIAQSGGDLFSAIVSVTQVCEPGPVREELISVRNEVSLGVSLGAALTHVSERIATPEANAVFTTLAQSLEMGTSVAENLRNAAALIRRQGRVRAQEQAQKAVVAMSFPLLLLILPGVFIVLLGPLVIQFISR